jgi:hypothetical protein
MAAKLFRYVLNFLRSQCMSLAIETDSRAKLKAILIEAEFFQVKYFIFKLVWFCTWLGCERSSLGM